MSGLPYIDPDDRATLRDLADRIGKVIEVGTRSGANLKGAVTCVSARAFHIETPHGGVCLIPSELVWWDDASTVLEEAV